jgi:hypothetical protein
VPSISITNNTTIDIVAASADTNATLNRYLVNDLKFLVLHKSSLTADSAVKDLDANGFPLTLGATGASSFALKGTSLDVSLDASASLGLLTGDDMTDFWDSSQLPHDPTAAALVSFEIEGTLDAGDTATVNDFCFGISKGETVTLTSFCPAAANDSLAVAAKRSIAALTIPHGVDDLKSLPANAICRIGASSSLTFTASVSYDVLNNPLATTTIAKLPSLAVNAKAGATVEATATHTSGHTITIAKLSNGFLHLSVSLKKTDDFESSLTVSAGVTGTVGSTDALSFLLSRISPNSTAEMEKIQTDLPAAQAEELSWNIKTAIDVALSSSLQVSLKAALDDKESNNRVFLYEIDLSVLDAAGMAAVHSALIGDFTAITRPGVALQGVRELDSALTTTSKVTHTLTVHLLGIFNWSSTSTFIEKSKVDYTKDTHEIVLSDEKIQVVGNNLNAEKIREVVSRGITLTIPASANTPEAEDPIQMFFFDRQASTSSSTMTQFTNVLTATGVSEAADAQSLLGQGLKHYGSSSLYLGLNLTPAQCRLLFLDKSQSPYPWTTYVQFACAAEAIILASDTDNVDRLKLFQADIGYWKQLEDAGAAPNVIRLLADRGIRQNAIVDVNSILWWSGAMGDYAKALAHNQSLVDPGKKVIKDGTLGFNEPWLVLATWLMLGKPAVDSLFHCSLLKEPPAIARTAGS